MLKLSLEAEKDILNAYNWYEDKTEGLGLKFIECIDKKMININNNPFIYQKIYEEIRIAVIKEFPYSIFYLKENIHIKILSIFHSSRDPINWDNKTKTGLN